MTTEDDMMAYVDGELSPSKRDAFEARLARDPRLRQAVEKERLLRRRFAETYDSALTEELPPRLERLLDRPRPRILPFRRRNPGPARWRWQQLTALAASLALAVFVAHDLVGTGGSSEDEAAFRIAGETAEALDVQLASTQAPTDPVQIGVSFVGPVGRPCRTFEVSEGAGLACRSGGEWQLRLFVPGAGSPGSEYQRAGSASAEVMREVQEMIAGEPMDARQERQARDADWPAVSE